MRARTLLWAGTVAAVLSLGLPWRSVPSIPGYVTTGYYVEGYCDFDGYCVSGAFVPGLYVPGLSGGSYAGFASDARFFIAAAIALALAGWYRSRPRWLRRAAYVALAGIALYAGYGLTGGMATLLVAAGCFWWAARRDSGASSAVEAAHPPPSTGPSTG